MQARYCMFSCVSLSEHLLMPRQFRHAPLHLLHRQNVSGGDCVNIRGYGRTLCESETKYSSTQVVGHTRPQHFTPKTLLMQNQYYFKERSYIKVALRCIL